MLAGAERAFAIGGRSIELSGAKATYNRTYAARGPFIGYRPFLGARRPGRALVRGDRRDAAGALRRSATTRRARREHGALGGDHGRPRRGAARRRPHRHRRRAATSTTCGRAGRRRSWSLLSAAAPAFFVAPLPDGTKLVTDWTVVRGDEQRIRTFPTGAWTCSPDRRPPRARRLGEAARLHVTVDARAAVRQRLRHPRPHHDRRRRAERLRAALRPHGRHHRAAAGRRRPRAEGPARVDAAAGRLRLDRAPPHERDGRGRRPDGVGRRAAGARGPRGWPRRRPPRRRRRGSAACRRPPSGATACAHGATRTSASSSSPWTWGASRPRHHPAHHDRRQRDHHDQPQPLRGEDEARRSRRCRARPRAPRTGRPASSRGRRRAATPTS